MSNIVAEQNLTGFAAVRTIGAFARPLQKIVALVKNSQSLSLVTVSFKPAAGQHSGPRRAVQTFNRPALECIEELTRNYHFAELRSSDLTIHSFIHHGKAFLPAHQMHGEQQPLPTRKLPPLEKQVACNAAIAEHSTAVQEGCRKACQQWQALNRR